MDTVFIFTSFRHSFSYRRQILDGNKKVEGNNVPKTEIIASKYSVAGTRNIWDIYDFCFYWMWRKNNDISLDLVGLGRLWAVWTLAWCFFQCSWLEKTVQSWKKIWALFSGDVFHYIFLFLWLLDQVLFYLRWCGKEPVSHLVGSFFVTLDHLRNLFLTPFPIQTSSASHPVMQLPSSFAFICCDQISVKWWWEMGSCVLLRLNGGSRTNLSGCP